MDGVVSVTLVVVFELIIPVTLVGSVVTIDVTVDETTDVSTTVEPGAIDLEKPRTAMYEPLTATTEITIIIRASIAVEIAFLFLEIPEGDSFISPIKSKACFEKVNVP